MKTAIIFGVTGITGRAVAERLLADGEWEIIGASRRPPQGLAGIEHIATDLLDTSATTAALAGRKITHVFHCAWIDHPDRTEKARINGDLIGGALDAAATGGALVHAALVTGLSHYMGGDAEAPYTEDMPRGGDNPLYYAQEDMLFAQAERHSFNWSVARPGTIIGYAPGNAMNLGTSVAVYATICRETGRPFVFPGTSHYYNGLADVTDSRLLARHMIWEATTPAAANQAFNVVNGDLFRWKGMWKRIADYFGVEVSRHPGTQTNLAAAMADAQQDWDAIVVKFGLAPNQLSHIAPFWHMDLDLGRPFDTMADITKSRELGFYDHQSTWRAFADLFARLKTARIIP